VEALRYLNKGLQVAAHKIIKDAVEAIPKKEPKIIFLLYLKAARASRDGT